MINTNRLVDEFCSLVEIDSISFQEQEMADCLQDKLEQIGLSAKRDERGNIYAILPGNTAKEPLLFSAHMDTVVPGIGKKAVRHPDGRITSQGDTVLGADDIAGVVEILEALRVIQENNLPHGDIEIIFFIAEEVYLKGSEAYDYSHVISKEAYVLDLSGEIGTAALSAPTVVAFTAEFTGKASHAGFSPEEGIHAVTAACRGIAAIKQGHIDEETTANVGTIKGGLARNIIPEFCSISGEVRSLRHERALEEIENIKAAFQSAADSVQAVLKFETSFGSIAYQVSQKHSVAKRFERACSDFSIEYCPISTFGASDNNSFFQHGITGIVMACGMHQVHSCNEFTRISDLEKCANITLKLMTSDM